MHIFRSSSKHPPPLVVNKELPPIKTKDAAGATTPAGAQLLDDEAQWGPAPATLGSTAAPAHNHGPSHDEHPPHWANLDASAGVCQAGGGELRHFGVGGSSGRMTVSASTRHWPLNELPSRSYGGTDPVRFLREPLVVPGGMNMPPLQGPSPPTASSAATQLGGLGDPTPGGALPALWGSFGGGPTQSPSIVLPTVGGGSQRGMSYNAELAWDPSTWGAGGAPRRSMGHFLSPPGSPTMAGGGGRGSQGSRLRRSFDGIEESSCNDPGRFDPRNRSSENLGPGRPSTSVRRSDSWGVHPPDHYPLGAPLDAGGGGGGSDSHPGSARRQALMSSLVGAGAGGSSSPAVSLRPPSSGYVQQRHSSVGTIPFASRTISGGDSSDSSGSGGGRLLPDSPLRTRQYSQPLVRTRRTWNEGEVPVSQMSFLGGAAGVGSEEDMLSRCISAIGPSGMMGLDARMCRRRSQPNVVGGGSSDGFPSSSSSARGDVSFHGLRIAFQGPPGSGLAREAPPPGEFRLSGLPPSVSQACAAFLDSMNKAVCVLSRDGILHYVNARWTQLAREGAELPQGQSNAKSELSNQPKEGDGDGSDASSEEGSEDFADEEGVANLVLGEVGDNFREACLDRHIAWHAVHDIQMAANGVLQVLEGELPSFECNYSSIPREVELFVDVPVTWEGDDSRPVTADSGEAPLPLGQAYPRWSLYAQSVTDKDLPEPLTVLTICEADGGGGGGSPERGGSSRSLSTGREGGRTAGDDESDQSDSRHSSRSAGGSGYEQTPPAKPPEDPPLPLMLREEIEAPLEAILVSTRLGTIKGTTSGVRECFVKIEETAEQLKALLMEAMAAVDEDGEGGFYPEPGCLVRTGVDSHPSFFGRAWE
eukprot:jgi/Mesvir1/8641/Mv02587-RA.1